MATDADIALNPEFKVLTWGARQYPGGPVVDLRGVALDEAVVPAVPRTRRDAVPGFDLSHESGQFGGIVLAIGVHHHQDLGALLHREVESPLQSRGLSAIAPQALAPDLGKLRGQFRRDLDRLITGSVINDKDLRSGVDESGVVHDPRKQVRQVLGLVEGRDNHP